MQLKIDDIRKILDRAVGPESEVIDYSVKPFFQQRNAGMNGDFYSVEIKIKEKNEQSADRIKNNETESTKASEYRSLKFFAKTTSSSAAMCKLSEVGLREEEIEFYKSVLPILLANSNNQVQWAPRCYLVHEQLIVLEDLRERNFRLAEGTMFEESPMLEAVESLARFHACSIAAEARLGQPLNRVFPRLFKEKIYKTGLLRDTPAASTALCRSTKLAFDTLALIAQRLDYSSDARLVPAIFDYIADLVKPLPQPTGSNHRGQLRNVICHGDLWRTNILLNVEEKDDKPRAKCILIDYQLLRYASPCTDLAMLLCLHATRQFRQHSESRLVDHYYSLFQRILEEEAPADIPSRADFIEDYFRCRLLGLACMCLSWPKVVFSSLLDDPSRFEDWYTRNRIDVYQACMDQDPDYKRRMSDNLRELFDEARRLLPAQ